MMWSDVHDGMDGWFGASVWMALLWLLVVFVTIAVTRGGRDASRGSEAPTSADPMRLLDQRFARGEIDAEEYQERRALLR
jgi:putative membrane protein